MLEQWNRWLEDHPRLAGGLLFLTTYVVFCGTLSNLFVHDDIPQVLENPFLRNVGLWTRIFTGSVWSFRGPAQHDNMYRPLQFITYWALYRLKGPNPVVFHLASLALLCRRGVAGFPSGLRTVTELPGGFCRGLALGAAPLARGNRSVDFSAP